ncbi:MAG TPA: hypothetical protein VE988_20190 [Gemmataceae bacterium]|nr:hypothetical protein [Gemmataceae bacterium]
MQYKTICLEILRQRPELYERLRSRRMLLPATEQYALELKARHEAWKAQLRQASPRSNDIQIASEAMELAVEELERRLPPASPTDETKPLSLDRAMAFIQSHTPPA